MPLPSISPALTDIEKKILEKTKSCFIEYSSLVDIQHFYKLFLKNKTENINILNLLIYEIH